MTKPGCCLLAVMVLVAVPATLVAQGAFFFKQADIQSISIEGLLENQSRWLLRVDKPETLKGVPVNAGGRMYYFTGSVGDREVVAAIELGKPGKPRLLYIDLNGNNDLSDETPIASTRIRSSYGWGWSQSYCFGPLTFAGAGAESVGAVADKKTVSSKPAAGQDATRPSADAQSKIGPTSFFVEQLDLDYLLVRPAVCRKGTLRLNGKSYAAVLVDGNFNGRYDDVFKFPLGRGSNKAPNADMLAIDYNNNGRFDSESFEVSELQPLTKLIQLQNGYYSVEVAADGSTVSLDEGRPVLGKLDLGKQEADLVVTSENGTFRLACASQPYSLPAGKYRLTYATLKATDEKKVNWSLQGRGPDKEPAEFEVTADRVVSLKLGQPLSLTTSERTSRSLLSGRTVSFGISCKDALGVEYQAGADRSGPGKSARSSAPSVKIVDEAGNTVSSGKFEYG